VDAKRFHAPELIDDGQQCQLLSKTSQTPFRVFTVLSCQDEPLGNVETLFKVSRATLYRVLTAGPRYREHQPRRREEFVENFRFMEEQKIRKALGPRQWEQLKNSLSQFCSEIMKSSPSVITFRTEGIYDVEIVNHKNGKGLSLTYNADVPCVFYQTPTAKGQIGFRVNADGMSVQPMLDDIPKLIEEIAASLIGRITG
jgi:hypothetical protein